jgi:hypothetical protein
LLPWKLCCCYDGIWRVEVVETLFHKTTAKSKSHSSKGKKNSMTTKVNFHGSQNKAQNLGGKMSQKPSNNEKKNSTSQNDS